MLKLLPLAIFALLSLAAYSAPVATAQQTPAAQTQIDEKKIKSLIEDLKDAMDEARTTDSEGVDKFTITKGDAHSFSIRRLMTIGEVQSVDEIEIPWNKINSIGLASNVSGEIHDVVLGFSEKLDYFFAVGSSVVPAKPKKDQTDSKIIRFKKRKEARGVRDIFKKILDEVGVKYTEKEDGTSTSSRENVFAHVELQTSL